VTMEDIHTIPGWYWAEEGYETDGSTGPFMTFDAALRHAKLYEAEDAFVFYLSAIDLARGHKLG